MLLQKKLINFGLFIFFALMVETINFVLLDFGIAPKFIIFNIAFILMLGTIFFLIPYPRIQFITQTIFLVLQMIISIVNINLQAITGEIFFWDMIVLLKDANAALQGTSILDLTAIWLYISITFLMIAIYFFIQKKIQSQHVYLQTRDKIKPRSLLVSAIFSIFVFLCGIFMMESAYLFLTKDISTSSEEEILLSDAYLYETMFQPKSTIKTFGSYTFYIKGLSFYLGVDTNAEAAKLLLDEYFAEGTPESNAYTGISEGNNVIMILLESFEYIAIDPALTPTLYKLFYEEGILLSNFHAKVKTDVAEAASLFGSYHSHGSLFRHYIANIHSTSLPNMLRDHTNMTLIRSFHNNVGTFYNRNIAHLRFGFDEHIDSHAMNLSESNFWINSDSEMIQDQVEAMIPNDETNFFTFITTFTMHGGYEYREAFADTYAYFDSIGYCDSASTFDIYQRTYMAASMNLDKALGNLFDRLQSTQQLENTTIVMYGDHLAYYYGFSHWMKGMDPNNSYDVRQYKVPALIYDYKLKAKMQENDLSTIDKFTSVYDLVPTVLNLLGVEFNPLWYVGVDVFSPIQTVIISKQGGIFNDYYYTLDGINPLYTQEGANVERWKEFQTSVAMTLKRTQQLNLLYKINYFHIEPIDEPEDS